VSAAVAFVVGLTFALGLGLGGMTQPARVLAFLDVAGRWDPSLALVMLGAITVYALGFRLATRRGRPVLAPAFALPARTIIDVRLVAGAVVFGVGWGLAGLCPGPAITSLGSGKPEAAVFVAAMLGGMMVQRLGQWLLSEGTATLDHAVRQRQQHDARKQRIFPIAHGEKVQQRAQDAQIRREH
jgi:uncharacterized membrane protein YedE/YeeE